MRPFILTVASTRVVMSLRELGAMGNCGCAHCLRTNSCRKYRMLTTPLSRQLSTGQKWYNFLIGIMVCKVVSREKKCENKLTSSYEMAVVVAIGGTQHVFS